MDEYKDITHDGVSAADVVDSAVGMPESCWFVAIVHSRSEKQSAERLTKMGFETYVPIQKEIGVWRNGRKSKVDRIVIPSTLFIRCTEQQRKEIVKLPYIYRFMTNKAGATANSGHKRLAVVSDHEIQLMKFMLGQSDVPVTISERPYKVGDKVAIIRGSLAGLEGEVSGSTPGKSEVVILLDFFGCAKLEINTNDLEIVKKSN